MMYYKLTGSIKRNEVGKSPQIKDAIWNLQKNELSTSFNDEARKGPVFGKFPIYNLILDKKAKATDLLEGGSSNLTLTLSESFYSFLSKTALKSINHQTWCITVFNSEIKSNFNGIGYKVKNIDALKLFDYKTFHISYPIQDFVNYSKSTFMFIKRKKETIEYDKTKFINKERLKIYDEIFKNKGIKVKINIEEITEDEVHFKSRNEAISKFEELNKIKNNTPIEEWHNLIKIKSKKIIINTKHIKEDIFRVFEKNIGSLSGYYVSEKLKNEIEKQGFTGIEFIPLNKITTAFDIEVINNNS